MTEPDEEWMNAPMGTPRDTDEFERDVFCLETRGYSGCEGWRTKEWTGCPAWESKWNTPDDCPFHEGCGDRILAAYRALQERAKHDYYEEAAGIAQALAETETRLEEEKEVTIELATQLAQRDNAWFDSVGYTYIHEARKAVSARKTTQTQSVT